MCVHWLTNRGCGNSTAMAKLHTEPSTEVRLYTRFYIACIKFVVSMYRSHGEGYQVPLSVVISPPLPHDQLLQASQTECPNDLARFILPFVLFWNPVQQFVMVFGDKPSCIKENCKGSLMLQCWKVGQSITTTYSSWFQMHCALSSCNVLM